MSNIYQKKYKNQYSFQQRIEEAKRVLQKYPDRRPIICEKLGNQHDLPNIDKRKYLVPCDLTFAHFIHVVRQRMKLRPEEAIFLFIGNQIVSGSSTIGYIYDFYKDTDGFLYVQYAKENVFG